MEISEPIYNLEDIKSIRMAGPCPLGPVSQDPVYLRIEFKDGTLISHEIKSICYSNKEIEDAR